MMENQADKLQTCLRKFIDHVSELENEEDPAGNGFHKEYRVLRDLASKYKEEDTFPATNGKLPYNVKKNRYRDIVPYDLHRVKLDQIPNTEGSDYINASFIEGAAGRAAYIASQGPLPHTLNDFWRMLWQYKVKVIIMACKEVEMGKKKCACYWPENTSKEATFNTIRVKLVNESNLADDCIERCMDVYNGNEGPLQIIQFHYTGWPDHGIPDDVDVILEMIAKMRAIRQRDKDFSPVVIHCSAGCGRTGTICAIDYAWEMLKTGRLEESFSLYDIIKYMREQRQSMIQTPEQYMMAHIAIRDLFMKHIDVIEGNIYANVNPDEYFNDNVDRGGASSQYYDVELADSYSYADPKQLLEKEVISIVGIYSDASTVEMLNSKPPLSPKPQIDQTKKPSPQTVNTAIPPLPEKPKENSPKPVRRTSKKVMKDKKEEELPRGQIPDQPSNKPDNYLNVFKGERYTNVDTPLQQESNNVPPPKPPLICVPSAKKDVKPAGPTFVETSPKPSGMPAAQQTPKQNNTQPPTAGKFVSSITVGSGGQATSLVSSGGGQATSTVPPSNKNTTDTNIYSFASSVKSEEPNKMENQGPIFKNSSGGGDVYAQVNKPSGSGNPAGNVEYSQVNKPTQALNTRHQNKGGGDPMYESIGTNGVFRPKPNTPTKGDVYEDVHVDGLYSTADPGSTDPTVPAIPDRGYRDDDVENKEHLPVKGTTSDNTSTLSRIKQKYFKGTADTNVDTSDIPGYNRRLAKKPKGKREKPSMWNKILK